VSGVDFSAPNPLDQADSIFIEGNPARVSGDAAFLLQ
jgi:hypothetical protein